eukprot:COSAG01_NODE_3810_length_5675_cov_115.679079_2_plen_812_part_01
MKPVASPRSAHGHPIQKKEHVQRDNTDFVRPHLEMGSEAARDAGFDAYSAQGAKVVRTTDGLTQLVRKGGGAKHVLEQLWKGLSSSQRRGYAVEEVAFSSFATASEPPAAALPPELLEAGGGMGNVVQELWWQEDPQVRERYLALAREQVGLDKYDASACKLFAKEQSAVLSDLAAPPLLKLIKRGGGEAHVLKELWNEQSSAVKLPYLRKARANAEARRLKARGSPGASPRKMSAVKRFYYALFEAITSLKERDGSTAKAITKWLAANKTEFLDSAPTEDEVKKKLKGGARSSINYFVKGKGNRYKVTKDFRKEKQKGAAKQREAARMLLKKTKEADRKRQLEEQRSQKRDREAALLELREAKRKLDASQKLRKGRLKELRYPIDDLQAMAEASLCDSNNGMQFFAAARKHREAVAKLEERTMELSSTNAAKSRFTEGQRIKMLLQDDDDSKAWYYGNVITMGESGMDLAFDDGDFQEGVAYDDPDVATVVQEAADDEPCSALTDFPPTLWDQDLPTQVYADLIAISSLLVRFSEDIDAPLFTLDELLDIIRGGPPEESASGATSEASPRSVPPAVVKAQRDALHVKLLHLLGEAHMWPEHFMHVEVTQDMVDAFSWPEVLARYIEANVPDDLPCLEPVIAAGRELGSKGYYSLSFEQRVCLLSFLCAEALETDHVRDVLEGDSEEHSKLIRDFEDSEKIQKDKKNEQLKKEREAQRERIEAGRNKNNEAKLLAKQEREAKKAAEVAEFQKWLASKNKPALEASDPKFKSEWKNWRSWIANEKKRIAAESRVQARKAEQEAERQRKKAEKE